MSVWPALIMALSSILSSIISKEKDKTGDYRTTTQVSEETYPHVQDPNYHPMSQYLMAALLKNYELKSGAGMPGGVGASSGMEDWTQSILEYLRQNLDTTLGVLGGKASTAPKVDPLIKKSGLLGP